MPYVKYTYSCPGGPNMTRLRGVGPRYAWLAGSFGPYASTSTSRAASRVPSGRIRTRMRPRSSGATTVEGRAKKDRGSRGPSLTGPSAGTS